MKKLLIILCAGILLIGCADKSDSNDSKSKDDDSNVSEEKKGSKEQDKATDEKKVYQIGETAQIVSNVYDFPYEVTVNSFKLTTDEVEGVSLEDKIVEVDEADRFAVVNVTIKNTSDRSFIPNEKISAQIIKGKLSVTSEDEIFKERDEELEPGEEITGDLVYVRGDFLDEKVLYLVYELAAEKEETKFELPVSS